MKQKTWGGGGGGGGFGVFLTAYIMCIGQQIGADATARLFFAANEAWKGKSTQKLLQDMDEEIVDQSLR